MQENAAKMQLPLDISIHISQKGLTYQINNKKGHRGIGWYKKPDTWYSS